MKQHALSILFIKIVLGYLCQAVQPYCTKNENCQSDEYCEGGICEKCAKCPRDVIDGIPNSFGSYYLVTCARRNTGHCPFWCGRRSGATPPSGETPRSRHQACRRYWSELTPPYSSPIVNIAADFIESTKTYNLTCSVQSVPLIPYIKWYDPSGAVVKEFAVEEVATDTLKITNFVEEEEGIYRCEAVWEEGISAGNASVQLNYTYVPPVTTLQPAQTSSEWSVTSKESGASPSPGKTPSSPDSSKVSQPLQPVVIAVLVLAPLPVVFGIILGICWICRKRCKDRYQHAQHAEEKIGLYADSIHLETSDFESGVIHGLSSLWNSNCEAVIVERVPAVKKCRVGRCWGNSNKRWKVPRDVNEWEIAQLYWSDVIEIWRKPSSPGMKKELVKTLTMNCLQVSRSSTSLTVRCPMVPNTFYVRIGEWKDEKTHWLRPAELMMSGKKEFFDLRPQVTYKIILGTRCDSANQGTDWQWSTTVQTESPSFLPIEPGETTATLQLKHRVPESYCLFITVNSSSIKEELSGGRYTCQKLIPGMLQVVQLKIQEEDTFRLLQEVTFDTTGSIPDGGDYEGDVTTALEDYDCRPTRKRRNKARVTPPDRCSTSLQEGLNSIAGGGPMSGSVDETTFQTIVTCLQHLFKLAHEDDPPAVQMRAPRKWTTVSELLVAWDLQRLCSIFDVMRRLAADTNFSSLRQIEDARELHGGHSVNCRLCNHALFLIERRESSQR
ncbi:uncharacterized protein [Diadema antillarum]|uniref:uncharacterized protein n=1 Tax=Diadema antillarum TaxID=105358 RepID=UPI003A89E6CD